MKHSERKQIQARLLRRVADGETKAAACAALGVSRRTVSRWLERDAQFADRWRAARIEQAHSLADEAIAIANEQIAPGDMAAIQRNRLRVDTVKWFTAKIAPRLYGDRLITESTVTQGVVILPALKGDGTPIILSRGVRTNKVPSALNAASTTVPQSPNSEQGGD